VNRFIKGLWENHSKSFSRQGIYPSSVIFLMIKGFDSLTEEEIQSRFGSDGYHTIKEFLKYQRKVN
jgi:hypothetical protein